ncbi:MAG TPA: acetate uptake transporter [Methanocella sp.]|nr:acetate uptake transporter [Methanocella sp.]
MSERTTTSTSMLANPAPLGLMGFGATTVLLNLHNAGIIAATSLGMIFAMGIFYGGIAQIIAGMLEFRKGNTFGTLAFTSYGLFWIALVGLLVFPKLGWADPVDGVSMAYFLGLWGVFTTYMFVGTLKKNRALQFVFGSLAVLFFLLAIGDYTGIAWVKTLAGYEGIICGLSAIYLACAEVLNETYGKAMLPV